MIFSTNLFLFIFLPLVLITYYGLLKNIKIKNLLLFASSIFFYACGEPIMVLLMISSIIVNYLLGLLLIKNNKRKTVVLIAIIYNIGMLFVFKYLNFFAQNIGYLLNTSFIVKKIALPIGISFYTFQALSYILDIYFGKATVQKSVFNLGLYISFFPQLIAGPIVRYETIDNQILNRKESFTLFNEGVSKFIIGLSKKVIISNNVAILADIAFSNIQTNTVCMAWLGAIAYTIQIYFDFSGYSDMAIGLGKMFGFEFNENFNYPYISKSVTEFWRRWHISLGSWFRDYVYIPLGGNRTSKVRHIFNLFIVWLCTGFWHGANWTFIIWGLMYFIVLMIEKQFNFDKKKSIISSIIGNFYTLIIVMIGWVIFRAENIFDALTYLKSMFNLNGNLFFNSDLSWYFKNFFAVILFGIIGSIPLKNCLLKYKNNKIVKTLYNIFIIVIFLISISFMARKGYNPFIYFNF